MNRPCMLWYRHGGAAAVLVAITASQAVHAQEPELAPEFLEVPACAVSDQDVVRATARQKVTLETPRCTADLRHRVDGTRLEINRLYGAFYRQAHLNQAASDAVALLLVRRRLLTSRWSAGLAEHHQISNDATLLNDIDRKLQEHLDAQQLALLEKYEETLSARYLLDPVSTLLIRVGRPLSEAQWAVVLPATQQLFEGRVENRSAKATPGGTEPPRSCREIHATANRYDEQIESVLAGALDEEQLETAHAYYRDLYARRARSLRSFQELYAGDEGAAGCTYPAN